jgi:hypothetical protein
MFRALARFVLLPILLVLALLATVIWAISSGLTGDRHPRGPIAEQRLPETSVAQRQERQSSVREVLDVTASVPSQILFGDLHVHTTYSADAFIFSLPLIQGEGVHPPADACDFARFCAELDFWSVNDHAEMLLPWQWQETVQSIRECNAVAGDAASPDLVSFLGWEWTQSAPEGLSAEGNAHYGHKNVILLGTEDDEIPTRPIGAAGGGLFSADPPPGALALARFAITALDFPGNLRPYLDFNRFTEEAKLDDWNLLSLVIPHGTTWGIHAPRRADLAEQLRPGGHDPARQRLFEVYSGHGNSEQWRSWRDVVVDEAGAERCAEPADGYLPCCWQAGEIIRERCGDVSAEVCEERVANARQYFVDAAGPTRFGVVPGATPDDWLECGQLPDGFLPALDYRPKMSAQYGLAVRNPAAGPEDGAFRYGLIGSSDNHKARAGAGYKETGRKAFGDAYGLRRDWWDLTRGEKPKPPEALPPDQVGFTGFDPGSERSASFYYTAGLVAVHSPGRDRRAIFDALESRHAYGTSGPRILLWFDLENGPGGAAPMGSEVFLPVGETPRFSVRAAGSYQQLPGCPAHTEERLTPERLQRLCLGECYHPSDVRIPIQRIEVVRIRPQQRGDEPLDERIEDPWRSFDCQDEGEGCTVSFEDPDYDGEQELLYYVRALQAPTDAVNGDPMRCERDADGRCLLARYCAASGPDFEPDDDCLSPVQERAWSSPIWLRPAPSLAQEY